MAEHTVEDTQRVLRQCASTLLSAVSRLGRSPSTSTSGSLSSLSGERESSVSMIHSTSASTALQEHRRLFGFQPQTLHTARVATSTSRSRGKRQKVEKPQWSHAFVCLGKVDDQTLPSFVEKGNLAIAGLGERKVSFPPGKGCKVLIDALEEEFPKLRQGGGFEILRCEGKSLRVIPPPPGGYTVEYLRGTLNQAKGYIRPLQRDLSEEPSTSVESNETFTVQCLGCSRSIPCNEFRSHQDNCTSTSGTREVPANIDDNEVELSASHFSPQDISLPGPSRPPTEQGNLEQLREMFPEKSSDDLVQALSLHGNVRAAALSLSSNVIEVHEDDVSSDDDSLLQPSFPPSKGKIDSLQSLLKELGNNMSQEKVKVNIEEEDILNDALAHYKSPEFDAKKRLRIQFKGQPAVDTGGVTREFFTKLFQVICEMFFQGGKYKSPVYSADIVASGLMRYFGTMIVHSILQGGPGFAVFSPSVYCYIATGNIDAAMAKMNYGDCSEPVKHFIDKVAQAADVAILDKEECSNMLSECGLAVALTNDNKIRVIQGIIIHDVIGRPKIILDQLAEGLNTLGFRTAMKEYPELLEALFIPSEEKLNADSVIGVLQFPKAMDDNESAVAGYIHMFIQNAEVDTLEKFLFFATGAKVLPDFGLGRIQVKFDRVPSIFASTCLFHITFPHQFEDLDSLSVSLQAVINTATGQSFNCV